MEIKINHQIDSYINFKSSRGQVFCKKGVLKNFSKFTRKHLCRSLFYNKVEINTSGACFCKLYSLPRKAQVLSTSSNKLLLVKTWT